MERWGAYKKQLEYALQAIDRGVDISGPFTDTSLQYPHRMVFCITSPFFQELMGKCKTSHIQLDFDTHESGLYHTQRFTFGARKEGISSYSIKTAALHMGARYFSLQNVNQTNAQELETIIRTEYLSEPYNSTIERNILFLIRAHRLTIG